MLALAALPAVPAAAREPVADTPAVHPFASHVTEASQRFAIPEAWIWRVMHVESRGRSRAVSHAGAMGLMQIMPATWAMLTARYRLGSDPFDVRANIIAGAAYLRMMWDRYGDVSLMLAAYNAGPGRADAYAAGRRGLPAETVAYVAAIAPSIGASGVASLAPAPTPTAPGWRSASLFARQSDGDAVVPSGADPLHSKDNADAARTAPPRAPVALFVPRSGRDQ
ncbi:MULTISPECIES: lytic transglycosylase domain-containing protein [unclassified Sphingopyxis]|uniref:lytic transglycosylase domain-containing protein n=1 Tax=unclassified Sphingopyxis TaxID=2614943 RepID=UPI0024ACC840|nr:MULTISPECIES: lytic transglycosylase domain-containing protein [unclassified Sphingopyxis]